MTKKFIQIHCYKRNYKLNTKDVKHVSLIHKKLLPQIPIFQKTLKSCR
jgi:hypothetical protein